MAVSRSNQMPMVTCPTCEQEFQWDDYYDVSVGHSRECPNCGNACEVIEVDQVTVVALQGMREAERRGARKETRTLPVAVDDKGRPVYALETEVKL